MKNVYQTFGVTVRQFTKRFQCTPENLRKKVNPSIGLKLKISKRTLQTLRDNGTLAYTKIGNRTYYLPEDVERIVTKVEDRRKDARYRGHTI